jgi:hypothetical protein
MKLAALWSVSAAWAVGQAAAAPIVALDLDPTLAGVQATLTATATSELQIDVVISGVDSPPLAGFEMEIGFDPAVLALVSVTNGGFLASPFFFDVFPGESSVAVDAGIRSFGEGPVGDGILAHLTFEAVGLGASLLNLDAVLYRPLGALFPDPTIPTEAVHGGAVTVTPEPSTAALVAFGCALTCMARKSRIRSARTQCTSTEASSHARSIR